MDIFFYARQASGRNVFIVVWLLMLAEKKQVLSLLSQKMLVEASEISFASNEQCFCTPKDPVEVVQLFLAK